MEYQSVNPANGEIKNTTLGAKIFDPVNRDLEHTAIVVIKNPKAR